MHRLVIALVTLLGLTGATVVGAYLFLSGASIDRAASLAPANTAVSVRAGRCTGSLVGLVALPDTATAWALGADSASPGEQPTAATAMVARLARTRVLTDGRDRLMGGSSGKHTPNHPIRMRKGPPG